MLNTFIISWYFLFFKFQPSCWVGNESQFCFNIHFFWWLIMLYTEILGHSFVSFLVDYLPFIINILELFVFGDMRLFLGKKSYILSTLIQILMCICALTKCLWWIEFFVFNILQFIMLTCMIIAVKSWLRNNSYSIFKIFPMCCFLGDNSFSVPT